MPFFRRRGADARPRALPRQLMEPPSTVQPHRAPTSGRSLREVAPACDDRWLMGAALRDFQERHGCDEAGMAAHLGLTLERLRWLQMRTRPNPASATYADDIRRLAATFRCDADVLRAVLST